MNNAKSDPLAEALQRDDVVEVTRLITEGRSISERLHFGRTPLHIASESGANHCVFEFLGRGADIEALDEFGYTPLFVALQSGHTEAARCLVAAGARLHYVFETESTSEIRGRLQARFRQLMDEAKKAHPEVFSILDADLGDTDKGAFDSEMEDNFVQATVSPKEFYAVHHCGNLETLRFVVMQPGVSLDVHDGASYWPLKTFAENGNSEAVDWLLKHGAAPNFTSTGDTALHASVAGNHLECARLLLHAGANPNQQDVDGCVPMWRVASDEMLDLLLEHGADATIGDQCGFKPSHWVNESKLKARLLALEKQ